VILIPCYNEEDGIGLVLDNIPHARLNHLGLNAYALVIDNNSSDNTTGISLTKGATVIHEKRQGKGYAIQAGFRNIPDDTDIVVMIDGDGSYDIGEIARLIEPLESNFADAIIG